MNDKFLVTNFVTIDEYPNEIRTVKTKIKITIDTVARSYDVALKHSDVALLICHLKNNSCLSANREVVID